MTRQINHRYLFCIGLFISIMLITACGTLNQPQVELLPTVALLPSPTQSDTPVPEPPTLPPTWTTTPTETTTPTPTLTLTLTITPSLTITDTPTVTYTPTPLPTQIPRPIVDLIQLAYEATILPADFVVPQRDGIDITLPPLTTEPDTFGDDSIVALTSQAPGFNTSVNCPFYPVGGFATAYTSDAVTAQLLGCPAGNPPNTLQVEGAYQEFERGTMIWLNITPKRIYALYNDGSYQQFTDTFDASVDPESGGETPPAGLREPTRGFGKVWRTFTNTKANLGWASGEEVANPATIQAFTHGQMIYIPGRTDIVALVANPDGATGTWKFIAGGF